MLHCKDSQNLSDHVTPCSMHAVITDPPYGLSLMGQAWDKVLPPKGIWKACFDALKPGGFCLSFGHTRLYHRVACDLEDAGFVIKDCLSWGYATGAPRPYNVDKAIDKHLGYKISDEFPYEPQSDEAKQWKGWANILKVSWEPIIVAQKPIEENIVHNVRKYKVGVLNIDECRIPFASDEDRKSLESFVNFEGEDRGDARFFSANTGGKKQCNVHPLGRWPGNLLWLEPLFADYDRIFMVPKPNKDEKGKDNEHTTVKPVRLMEHLVKLVTPRPSVVGEDIWVLDPFMGSGTTGVACKVMGRKFVGFENDPQSFKTAKKRINQRNRRIDIFDR